MTGTGDPWIDRLLDETDDTLMRETLGDWAAVAVIRRVWRAGQPEARGSLRDSEGRWPTLCAALDVIAGITVEQIEQDAEALARWDAEHEGER